MRYIWLEPRYEGCAAFLYPIELFCKKDEKYFSKNLTNAQNGCIFVG